MKLIIHLLDLFLYGVPPRRLLMLDADKFPEELLILFGFADQI